MKLPQPKPPVPQPWSVLGLTTLVFCLVGWFQPLARGVAADPWISPAAMVMSPDQTLLYVASATSGELLFVDLPSRKVMSRMQVGESPSGLALSKDGSLLIVTCAAPSNRIVVVDPRSRSVMRTIKTGHTAVSPVMALDDKTLFVCLRFQDKVLVVDPWKGTEIRSIPVAREPVAATLTLDGKHLLVAHHLPEGRVDDGAVPGSLSVVDVASGKVSARVSLPNGANLLRDVRMSPDGKHAVVTHTLARFQLPTSQVERGWMNANAITIVGTSKWNVLSTILLDQPEKGCANPWAAVWTADGKRLLVSHAGTHELSIIDFEGLLKRIESLPTRAGVRNGPLGYVVSMLQSDVPTDLGFLGGLRELVVLHGKGPRALCIAGDQVVVGHYFSEKLEIVDLKKPYGETTEVRLHDAREMTVERRGESYFNDATLCLQTWQSCASCHSSDARVDGLNWDLLNDGIGNPKNTKSLLRSHQTAPAMSMGVRDTAETAVRAGIHHILFMAQPEEVPQAIDTWLKGLSPESSPYLVGGKLSPSAERGRKLFLSRETACAQCHLSALYTDRKSYQVGTAARTDQPGDSFDTPTLLELWRTAPYLHDGSASTLREVLVERNQGDRHGKTSRLSSAQIDDLVQYLLSL